VEGVRTTAEENVTMNGNVNAIPCLSETDDARLPSEIEKSQNSTGVKNEKLRMTGMKYKER